MPILYGAAGQVLSTITAVADGTNLKLRTTDYGDLYVIPVGHGVTGMNAEGSYFRATSPTWGTGIAMSITTTFSATAALATIVNSGSAGAKSIHLDYIKLICTVAGATTTASDLGIILDTANRYSSGGTLLVAAASNSNVSTVALASIRFGAVVSTAASAPRNVSRDRVKTQAAPCWNVGDEVLINFGASDTPAGATNGAATNILPVPAGPVEIGPGHSCVIHMWNTANATTAPSWEVELGWWER